VLEFERGLFIGSSQIAFATFVVQVSLDLREVEYLARWQRTVAAEWS